MLISFLNTLLPAKHHIQDLRYSPNEQQGAASLDRKAIFDLHCTSPSGEYFIVELQKAKQNYFKDRSLYYATFPIQQQAQRGEWDYKLAAVYTVGILDFVFEEDRQDDAVAHEVVHTVQLKNQHGRVFYDKFTFIYLTLPHFRKSLETLATEQDKWFYLFRHLHELPAAPPQWQEAVFQQLFEVARIARFNPDERQAYEASLKYYRDLKNVTDTAWFEGREEGRVEGREEGRVEGREEGIQIGVAQGRARGSNSTATQAAATQIRAVAGVGGGEAEQGYTGATRTLGRAHSQRTHAGRGVLVKFTLKNIGLPAHRMRR